MKIAPMKVELIDWMGSDLSVVNAARVSFHKESDWEYPLSPANEMVHELGEKDQKLIGYLARHGHWTPFGHAFLSFRIKAPIFVARQLVKHQVGLVWNEVSRRYVDDEPEFWLPEGNLFRMRAENVKQGSSSETVKCVVQPWMEATLETYNSMLEHGIAPELARIILPQNTMTEWIWSGSLMAFARVCKLRLDPHAQQETREVAEQIDKLVPSDFQHSWKALLHDAA